MVPAMKLEFRGSHTLPLATIKERVEQRVAHYAERHPALHLSTLYRWEGERVVTASYRGATGRVTLGDRDARVDIELPFIARPFKAKIEAFITAEMDRVLAAEMPPG